MKRRRTYGRRTRGRVPKRSRRYGVRKTYRRRRSYRGRGGAVLRVKRMVYCGIVAPDAALNNNINNFWRYQTVSLANGINSFDALGTTRVRGLTNLSEYTPLFEQYKLGGVKLMFKPRMQDLNYEQSVSVAVATRVPRVVITIDPRSTLTPSGTYGPDTLNTMLENGGKVYRGDRPFQVYLKPQVTEQYGGGANRYMKPRFTDLTTSAGQNMEHRGFHMYLMRDGFDTSSTNLAWDVFATYYLTFRNPK